MANVLIVRYRRLGDAIIPLPLIYSIAKENPQDNFIVITHKRLVCLFRHMPGNVSFIIKPEKTAKNLKGVVSHGVKAFFFKSKMKRLIKRIDKVFFLQCLKYEKKLIKLIEKQQIPYAITEDEKINSEKPEETIIGLHKQTFASLGYPDIEGEFDTFYFKTVDNTDLFRKLGIDPGRKLISIAPFSLEKSKIYPLEKMEEILAYFNSREQYQVVLLGGGQIEKEQADKWVEKYPQLISLIHKLSFEEEARILAASKVLLTMDSANMHLGALMNTPVVSVWGGTVPENGYYPYNQPLDLAIVKRLPCQPCSIWGHVSCNQPNLYTCFDISPVEILSKIRLVIED